MSPFVRYSLMRLTLLMGVLALLYLVGARGLMLLLLAAVISAGLSYVLLRGPRDELALRIVDRTEGRIQGKLDRKVSADNAEEDADLER